MHVMYMFLPFPWFLDGIGFSGIQGNQQLTVMQKEHCFLGRRICEIGESYS